jgi:hypothetical protein
MIINITQIQKMDFQPLFELINDALQSTHRKIVHDIIEYTMTMKEFLTMQPWHTCATKHKFQLDHVSVMPSLLSNHKNIMQIINEYVYCSLSDILNWQLHDSRGPLSEICQVKGAMNDSMDKYHKHKENLYDDVHYIPEVECGRVDGTAESTNINFCKIWHVSPFAMCEIVDFVWVELQIPWDDDGTIVCPYFDAIRLEIGGQTIDTIQRENLGILIRQSGFRTFSQFANKTTIFYIPIPFAIFSQSRHLPRYAFEFHECWLDFVVAGNITCDKMVVKCSGWRRTNRTFHRQSIQILFDQNQFQSYDLITSSQKECKIPLNFNHPTSLLYFTFANHDKKIIHDSMDISLSVKFDSIYSTGLKRKITFDKEHQKCEQFPGFYFLNLQTLELECPNFSRWNNIYLNVRFNTQVNKNCTKCLVFGTNSNFLLVKEQMAGMMFTQ